jgi:hypothetical protein
MERRRRCLVRDDFPAGRFFSKVGLLILAEWTLSLLSRMGGDSERHDLLA